MAFDLFFQLVLVVLLLLDFSVYVLLHNVLLQYPLLL